MNYTEKRLERTIEQIGIASYGGISFIPSSRYKSDLIKILTKLTHQALAEERKRVVMEIRKRMPSHDAVMEYLSSLDNPLTVK